MFRDVVPVWVGKGVQTWRYIYAADQLTVRVDQLAVGVGRAR